MTNKIAAGVLSLAFAAAVAIGPNLASASIDESNTNTGPDSHNINRVRLRTRISERLTNRASARNDLRVTANTGDNKSVKNTSVDGDNETGDVDVVADLHNDLNGSMSDHNHDSDCDCMNNIDAMLSNDTTGPGSTNKNKVNISHRRSHRVTNSANVRNSLNVNGNTGGNTQKGNTVGGGNSTGDVSVSFTTTNVLN